MQLSSVQPASVASNAPDAVPLTAEPEPLPEKSAAPSVLQGHRIEVFAGIIIVLIGLALRLVPAFGVPDRQTMDEYLYVMNVKLVHEVGGPLEYQAIIHDYVRAQSNMAVVILPPTRCVYIILSWAWDSLFHTGGKMALRYVAETFSCLSFLLSGIFAFRLGGARIALVVSALMAVAPVELMLAHRELVDGVFAFMALLCLWLLWENMQRPGRLGWLAAFAGAVALMVLTKENAFFAAVGLGGILCVAVLFPGLNLGRNHWSTFLALFAGGMMGIGVLVCLAGSPQTLIETYRLLVTKAEQMSFAYDSGGGPWYRYIIDIMLVSPMVLLPAIGGIFALRRDSRQGIFLLLFVIFSCAVMVNVKNGMNLRYATMWDMPLRYLAAGIILQLSSAVRRAPVLAGVLLVALVGGAELHAYWLFFVHHDIGDPVTQYLMYATEIVRTGTGAPTPSP